MNEDILAQAIFDYFSAVPDAPYSFNEDASTLTISIDGEVDCRAMARAILETVAP